MIMKLKPHEHGTVSEATKLNDVRVETEGYWTTFAYLWTLVWKTKTEDIKIRDEKVVHNPKRKQTLKNSCHASTWITNLNSNGSKSRSVFGEANLAQSIISC